MNETGVPVRGSRLVLALVAVLSLAGAARADLVYASSLDGNRIVSVDLATNAVTTVANVAGPDSLLFDEQGRIIYTAYFAGQVRRFDPKTGTDTLLAGGLNRPVDIALEPGEKSLLVVQQFGKRIDRLQLATNQLSPLVPVTGPFPGGITYDDAGRLFAITSNNGLLAQLDPATGLTRQSTTTPPALDGLTYDPFSHLLYAASQGLNAIYSFDPNSLVSGAKFVVRVPGPDGLSADGNGNLLIAARGDFRLYNYDLNNGKLTAGPSVFGIDDTAPASGLGARPVNPAVPEPASVALLGLGLCVLAGARRLGRLSKRAGPF